MARYLLACWPLVGHVNPFLSIGTGIRQRGHDVAYYTGPSGRPALEDEGFRVYPFRQVDETGVAGAVTSLEKSAPTSRQALRSGAGTFSNWLAGTMLGQLADLEPIIEEWRPDVIVAETAMYGPLLVLWEAKHLPVAIMSTLMGCLVPGPGAPLSGLGLPPPRGVRGRLLAGVVNVATGVLASGMRRRIDRIRASYGLGPLGCSVVEYTGRLPLYLVPSVPELDYNRQDLPPSVHYIGPCVWNKPSRAAPPAWLGAIPTERPWVHVTEGTVHYQDPFVLRAAAQGLGGLGLEAILTSGPQRDPASLGLGPLAANVHVEQWVSHADLLPRCAAMVTTGGAGTVMAGLQAGVPLLIVPTHWDKADNAQRVVEAGVGLRLSPKQCTPQALRRAVERLLAEPSFRTKARQLALRLAQLPGPARAAELLEDLANVQTGADRGPAGGLGHRVAG